MSNTGPKIKCTRKLPGFLKVTTTKCLQVLPHRKQILKKISNVLAALFMTYLAHNAAQTAWTICALCMSGALAKRPKGLDDEPVLYLSLSTSVKCAAGHLRVSCQKIAKHLALLFHQTFLHVNEPIFKMHSRPYPQGSLQHKTL